jgi:carboxypeptidase family protein
MNNKVSKEELMTKWGGVVLLVLLFLAIPSRAFAQGGATGAINGVVQDKSGGGVAGARVTAQSESTKETLRTETTDSSGLFTMTLLPAGPYTIEVIAQGFADTRALGVIVRVTETTRLTIPLQVKSVVQSVEVSADVFTVKTADATTGESLSGSTIKELPLATQNFQQLLALSSGASSSLNSASQLGRGTVSINVNGGRDDNNNYQIEGIGANDTSIGELNNTPLPSPDVIQEFKVSTSLYDATQGRDGGGNINAILRTGAADYHFDVFEFFRNTVLDANDFFLNSFSQPGRSSSRTFSAPVVAAP